MKFSIFLIAILFSSISYSINKPSFNCQKASTHVEKSICASSTLSMLDSKLAKEYKSFFSELSPESKITAKRMQRLWLKSRNRTCTGEETVDCLTIQYNEWLKFMAKGVLVAKIPLEQRNLPLISPFNSNVRLELKVIPSDKFDPNDPYESEEFYKLSVVDGELETIIHEGNKYEGGMIDHNKDLISHVLFYLSPNGAKNVALYNVFESFAGRCEASIMKKLNFRNVEKIQNSISTITLYEEDSACGTYENKLFKWQVTDDGVLEYLELDNFTFYHQQRFTEIKATRINQTVSSEFLWVDESKESFIGRKYTKIIKNIEKDIWGLNKTIKTEYCEIPGNGLSDYWRFKEILSNKNIGFNQILYFSNHILKSDQLISASQYKPLLEAALMYLHKAREIPGWEAKLVEATSKYPQVQATSNFYFDGEADWKVNPFVQAGFYTDKSCYANAESPFGYASSEEWFYMFWARRVSDGNLEKAEDLLKLLIKMMENISLSDKT